MMKQMRDSGTDRAEPIRAQKATWMADGTHWPGTWVISTSDHSRGDHAGILQVWTLLLITNSLYLYEHAH